MLLFPNPALKSTGPWKIEPVPGRPAAVAILRVWEDLSVGDPPVAVLWQPVPPGVESTAGAVAVGRAHLFLALSVASASISRPWLRFPPPLIEPDVRLYRIRLSEGLHERACAGLR